MRPFMNPGQSSIACLFFFVLWLGGCRNDGRGSGLIETQTPTELQVPSTGAYGILVAGAFRAGIQEVTLRIGSEQLELSSYQGSLHFDTAKMSLLDVVLPESDFHLINRLDGEDGTVRFAGFAVAGFQSAVNVALTFECPVPIRSGDVTFDLEVLGTSAGTEIREEEVFELQKMVQEETR
jgi:hypothetical protein